MSQATVFLHAHVAAVNTFDSILRTILQALPINPNEKAAALTALDVVKETANGLDANAGTVIGDFAEEEGSARILTPVLSPKAQAVADAKAALAKAEADAEAEAAGTTVDPSKGV